jgi:hypothetical protein
MNVETIGAGGVSNASEGAAGGQGVGAPGATAPEIPAPSGDLVQDVMMLQLRSFRLQRQEGRERQVREREEEMRQALAAHHEQVKEAEQLRTSALVTAVVQTAALAVTTYFKAADIQAADAGSPKKPQKEAGPGFGGLLLRGLGDKAPDAWAAADATSGWQAGASRHRLAAGLAETRQLDASNGAEDAAGQVDELRRLESKVLDLLGQLQSGRSRNEEAALRA